MLAIEDNCLIQVGRSVDSGGRLGVLLAGRLQLMQGPLFHRWRRKDVYQYESGAKLMDKGRRIVK